MITRSCDFCGKTQVDRGDKYGCDRFEIYQYKLNNYKHGKNIEYDYCRKCSKKILKVIKEIAIRKPETRKFNDD